METITMAQAQKQRALLHVFISTADSVNSGTRCLAALGRAGAGSGLVPVYFAASLFT